MTKRFDVEQVADMLRCDAAAVRSALQELADARRLSAETFRFADAAWRVAPSDVASVQQAVRERDASGRPGREPGRRVVVRRTRQKD